MVYVIRSDQSVSAVAATARAIMKGLAPGEPIYSVEALDTHVQAGSRGERDEEGGMGLHWLFRWLGD